MEKAILRTKSIGTKVSDEEYAQLEKLAEASAVVTAISTRPSLSWASLGRRSLGRMYSLNTISSGSSPFRFS
jgi:hypothetical protein